jgi:hypothetical protein
VDTIQSPLLSLDSILIPDARRPRPRPRPRPLDLAKLSSIRLRPRTMPSPLLPLSSGSGSRGSMSSGLGLGYPNGSGSGSGSGSGFGDFGDFGGIPRSDRGLPILLRRLTKFKAMVSANCGAGWELDRIPVITRAWRVVRCGIGWRDESAAWREEVKR